MAAEQLYLDLLKKNLTDTIRPELGQWEEIRKTDAPFPKGFLANLLIRFLRQRGLGLFRKNLFDWASRRDGRDHPTHGESMVGFKRMENVQYCVERVLQEGVPGDLIEAGVWRGGTTIFMRGILKAYGVKDKVVWVADSFQGLPKPDPKKYPKDAGSSFHERQILSIPMEEVRRNFARYGLLDEQVRFLSGWFRDSLPKAPIKALSVLRLDADMYQSTMEALSGLYDKLSNGGYVIIDDYKNIEQCRQAVDDFRRERKISEKIQDVDWCAVYWRKGA